MAEKPPPKTYEEISPDPDKLNGPAGRNVMIIGGILVAILTTVISLFALLFAPKSVGTPTPFATATDRVLFVFSTETPVSASPGSLASTTPAVLPPSGSPNP